MIAKLTPDARRIVLMTIKSTRASGDRNIAAALDVLLMIHDRVHKQLADGTLVEVVERDNRNSQG